MNTPSNRQPLVITSVGEMQTKMLAARAAGQTIAFVPTMGYLHEGHLSLLRAGRERGDILVLSIFVNPTQFGVGEDFSTYPRDMQSDLDLAALAGVDYVFAPEAADMYPKGYGTFVEVEGITETLCGASRPGHFRGVTTVVNKLFAIIQPNFAFFGCKDFQQLAVIKRMVEDQNRPVNIIGMPIVRESDGLAMSSRNVYLTSAERSQSLALSDSMRMAVEAVESGECNVEKILKLVQDRIALETDAVIDYAEIMHEQTLEPMSIVTEESVLLLAVKVGKTRLLDNHYLCKGIGLS